MNWFHNYSYKNNKIFYYQDEETKKISLVNPKKAGEGIKILTKADFLKCKMSDATKKAILTQLASGEIHA